MQNDVYDYTSQGSVAKNTVLQKPTACSVCLSFLPLPAHSFPPKQALTFSPCSVHTMLPWPPSSAFSTA